jgi:AraC-like DNA-binding protein
MPHPLLRPLLPRGYAGFTEATTPRHLVLPADTSVSLVVKLADSRFRPPAFVRGGHDRSWVVDGDCAPAYMELRLAPLGAYRLLGLPMDTLSGRLVDLADLVGAAGRRLGEQLRDTSSWRQRFTLVDQFLLGRLVDGPPPAPEVVWAWRRLVASGGAVAIGRLATEVGWSHRHLITKFRQQVGLRPKTAARLVRFDRVRRRLDQSRAGPLDWGLLSAETGYADQPHLIREFRQFTGSTPTQFQAHTRPAGDNGEQRVNSVQDAESAAS